MEHSPVTQPLHNAGYCCLDSQPDLGINKHAWTRGTTMLYVEHPIGTGFSYGHPYPDNELEASADLYQFMQNFYQIFTKFQDYDFFVMGESYAGMFVPSIARYFHIQNKQLAPNNIKIPLKGAAVGNGWMDAAIQGPATIDYSWWHGLIDKATRDALHNEWHNCYDNKADTNEPPPFHPFNVQDDCGIMWGILQGAGNPNAYDITTWDPNVDQITFATEIFFNQDAVKEALHAPTNITWHGCRQGEGRRQLQQQHRKLYMDMDRPISVVPYVAELLNEGIPVLVYNGDRDMTTNMVGTESVLNQMEWKGKDGWESHGQRGLWNVDNYPAGWAKEYDNLTFVIVYNSGHMVPYNQPVPAFDLLQRFLQHQSFRDQELPSFEIERMPRNNDDNEDDKNSHSKMTSELQDTILPDTTATTTLADQGGAGSSSGMLLVAIASFFAGVLLTALWTKKNHGATSGYQPLPEANL